MDTAPDLWEVVWTVDGYDGERRAGPYSLSVAQEHQADIGGYEGCHAWIVPLALLDRLARDEEVRQLELVEDDFVPASGGGRVPLIDEDPPEDGEVAALRHRLACIREALQHDDVDAAKLLASEAPAGAEGPHGAGPAGASGRGGTSDWWMLAPLPQGRQRHGGGGVFVSDLTDSERAIIGGLVGVGEGCDA